MPNTTPPGAGVVSPSLVVGGTLVANGTTNNLLYVDANGTLQNIAQSSVSVSLTVGTTPISGGTNGRVLYDNNGVIGELATTGSGSSVLSSGPTLSNPIVGTQSVGDNSTKAASTAYVDVNHTRILGASGSPQSHTGDTNEFTLATVVVPAGAMGTAGSLRIWTFWSFSGTNGTRSTRVRFSGASGTQYLAVSNASTINSFLDCRVITNSNSASAQVGNQVSSPFGGTTTAKQTGTANTALQTSVVITGQLGNGSDTIVLEWYCVELIPSV